MARSRFFYHSGDRGGYHPAIQIAVVVLLLAIFFVAVFHVVNRKS